MPDLVLDAETRCHYRDTPWDERSFGIPTREILDIEHKNSQCLRKLIENFEDRNFADHVGLCYTRVSADDRRTQCILEEAGYKKVEGSYALSLANFAAFYPKNTFGRDLTLRAATADDLPILQEMAAEDFHYGRFAEDPNIPIEVNKQRQRNWIADMMADPAITIWVHASDTSCRGFHAFRQKGDHVDMILTGMAAKYQALAGFFWSTCLHEMAKLGTKTASTMISAANIPVVNLYARLGFRFDHLMIGMHKHYPHP